MLVDEILAKLVLSIMKRKTKCSTYILYREIQMGSGAKSNMRRGFLIYEEMHKYLHYI